MLYILYQYANINFRAQSAIDSRHVRCRQTIHADFSCDLKNMKICDSVMHSKNCFHCELAMNIAILMFNRFLARDKSASTTVLVWECIMQRQSNMNKVYLLMPTSSSPFPIIHIHPLSNEQSDHQLFRWYSNCCLFKQASVLENWIAYKTSHFVVLVANRCTLAANT